MTLLAQEEESTGAMVLRSPKTSMFTAVWGA